MTRAEQIIAEADALLHECIAVEAASAALAGRAEQVQDDARRLLEAMQLWRAMLNRGEAAT